MQSSLLSESVNMLMMTKTLLMMIYGVGASPDAERGSCSPIFFALLLGRNCNDDEDLMIVIVL